MVDDFNVAGYSHVPTREEVLFEEVAQRQKQRASLSISERYKGYERGLLEKIPETVKRAFYIIKERSVKKGLDAYDLHLRSQSKILAFANYSAQPAPNFEIKIMSHFDLEKIFGNDLVGLEIEKISQFVNKWHHNGVSTSLFKNDLKEGEVEWCLLDQTVVSSHDRINDKIAMMRQVECKETKCSVFYTGRCDSFSKAKEQGVFLLQTEMKKPFQNLKKLDQGEEFTYIVNNLMSSHGIGEFGISILAGFNERKSILDEQKVLEQLGPLKVGGKTVFLNPIYFNQAFNSLTFFGVPNLQKEINQRGYRSLFPIVHRAIREERLHQEEKSLLVAALKFLKCLDDLLPEEEFFYRDLICKILHLPQVIHCKSSTDRTMIAGAISMATAQWRDLKKDIPLNQPHAILSMELFKGLFALNILTGRQITQYARSSQGTIKGVNQYSDQKGFIWESQGRYNPILLRMLPSGFKRPAKRPFYIRMHIGFLECFGRWFHAEEVCRKRIDCLKSAYKKEAFEPKSFDL